MISKATLKEEKDSYKTRISFHKDVKIVHNKYVK